VVRGPNGAGKSTLLSALSGKLAPTRGTRTEGDGLALGVFTQDLAQDLDQEALATEVVTRKVREKDPTISDETARKALGALGLTGEKSLRKVGHLSGGEKARVALASFVLIPHNLLLLDEPSNHLDVTTLKVLTAALREFAGSVVVISHDRMFLEELDPTHVVTVRDGRVDCQCRGLREDDWNDPIDSRSSEEKFAAVNTRAASLSTSFRGSGSSTSASAIQKAVTDMTSNKSSVKSRKIIEEVVVVETGKTDDELRKMALNAPKRIKKIENSLEKHESDMQVIDDSMIEFGRDRGKLYDLQKSKNELQVKIDKLYAEYEELIELV